MKTSSFKDFTAFMILIIAAFLLGGCGMDQSKKSVDKVKEVEEIETTPAPFTNDIEGNIMGSSAGRYPGADAGECTSGSGGQRAWVDSMYQSTNSAVAETGHFYLYAVRKYSGATPTLVQEISVPVQPGSPTNIGLNVSTAQVISSTQSLGDGNSTSGNWRSWGTLAATSASVGGATVYAFRVNNVIADRSTGIANDGTLSTKTTLINTLNLYLANSSQFHLEYFSDSAMNQVMLLTGITQFGGFRYEFEFGREAQPLKPLRCSGYNYPVFNRTSKPGCRSAILGCSL